MAFRKFHLMEEATWQVLVLIPKVGGDYIRIGILVVAWNILTVIINLYLVTTIQFHDVLHGLQVGREIGTASLRAKLLQLLMAMREEVLYNIFLDFNKLYDTLDRDRCL